MQPSEYMPVNATNRTWYHDLFGCFTSVQNCAMSCFCPCVRFGLTGARAGIAALWLLVMLMFIFELIEGIGRWFPVRGSV